MNPSNQQDNVEWSVLKKVLSWPSGAAESILSRCSQPVQSYYCALGSAVYVASSLSGLGMVRVAHQVSGSLMAALIIAPCWAGIVLVLDRLLLMTTRHGAATIWGKVLPFVRIALSIALSLLIGEQIVQWFFVNEINNELAQERLEAQKTNLDRAGEAVPELAGMTQDKRNKEIRLERKEAEVSELRDAYIREAEGTAGSLLRGKGPLFEQKKVDYDRAVRELDQFREELAGLDARMQEKFRDLQAIARPANEAKAAEKGFMANHRALFRVIGKDWMLLGLYVALSFVMVAMEMIPLLAKLNHGEDMYDRLADADSFLRETQLEQETELSRHALIAESSYTKALDETRWTIEMQALNRAAQPASADSAAEIPDSGGLDGVAQEIARSRLMQALRARQVEPFSVTVLPDGDVGDAPFVLVFQHSKNELRGSDISFSLSALGQQRPHRDGMRIPFDECAVTNAFGEAIQMERPLLPQLKGQEVVCLSRQLYSSRAS